MDLQIQEILGNTDTTEKWKYDKLLEIDASNYTELGTDSTKTQREAVKKASRKIYKAIKNIQTTISEGKNIYTAEQVGQRFLMLMDKK